jgi:hypothetical protein
LRGARKPHSPQPELNKTLQSHMEPVHFASLPLFESKSINHNKKTLQTHTLDENKLRRNSPKGLW